MFFSKISLRNFGPFDSAEFAFSAGKLNVVQGGNGAGKSQLAGAVLAAIVGRAAIKIDRTGVGPSELRLSIDEGNFSEELTLSVAIDGQGDASVKQHSLPPTVGHRLGPLGLRLLTAISDPTGPRLILRRDIDPTIPQPPDMQAIGKLLPDGLKRDRTWLQIRANDFLQDSRRSGGEVTLGLLLWEFAKRRQAHNDVPLIVDEFLWVLPDAYVDFSIKILNAIAERSQVILLTHAARDWNGASVLSLDRAQGSIHSLTYYNYFLERQRPRLKQSRQWKWLKGKAFPKQENRSCELKEIKGANPLGSIKSVVDQYVVAFLNAGSPQEGAIFWGVRNEDLAIIGVDLSVRQCDELRRVVTEKLHQITPPLAPTAYQVHLHPVSDGRKEIRDLYVVEVRVPSARRTLLFSTGSQEVYVKTDAGKKRLSAMEIQQELLRRFGLDPQF